MVTQQVAVEKVNRFVSEIKKSGLQLRKVFLFGSYAKNNQQKYSDIDVALVADEFIGIGFEDIKKFVSILRNRSYSIIQPKTYPTDYFKKGDPFIDEIKKTGIEIKI